MIESMSVGQIANEIADDLKDDIFEVFTEECNKEVVEWCLVESELTQFVYYDKLFWQEFKNGFPEEDQYYWLTVITEDGDRKVVLTKWYGKNSFKYWKSKYRYLLAWKPCILPEPYKED